MKLICMDTSAQVASLAAMEDGALVAERWQLYRKNHSKILLPMLEDMLGMLGWAPRDVDVWSAITGPGSFTGVRIGVTTARALAHAWDKPVVGISALEALCMDAPQAPGWVAPLMDARRNQVYAAAYAFEGDALCPCIAPAACALEEMLAKLADRDATFVGDGACLHREAIAQAMGARAHFLPAHLGVQRASAAAVLAYARASAGETAHYNTLLPLYLRAPQAEREYAKRRAQGE
nr:tRNA (adenosine(37)-N6)-threonylcarbamoyltransferase complex dimerization subunit type 1 TsaB [Maliibacterium massiliense]